MAKQFTTARGSNRDVPIKLYEAALERLLENHPLRAEASGDAAQTLSKQEAEVLESVGLSLTPWNEGSGAADPLTQSIADYMALLEPSYTTSEAAKYLMVEASYDGEKRLPRFQFERKRVIPGMREVLAALPKKLNPLDVAEWFLSPNPDLEIDAQQQPLSPREWLLKGQAVGPVVQLAQGFE
jgi:hypothetical protein